jgi:hypothetical protein
MNRFLNLLLGIIAFCLVVWTIHRTYFSPADPGNFNPESTHSGNKVEVQAQKIDLKKIDKESDR